MVRIIAGLIRLAGAIIATLSQSSIGIQRNFGMSSQLDALQAQLDSLEKQLAVAKTTHLNAEKDYKKILDQILDVRRFIDELNKVANATIRVTDHAILRYAERFQNFDRNPIVDSIIAKIDMDSLKKLGGTAVLKVDGMRIVLDNFTVITITEL